VSVEAVRVFVGRSHPFSFGYTTTSLQRQHDAQLFDLVNLFSHLFMLVTIVLVKLSFKNQHQANKLFPMMV
jgi:hypothetical protein